MELSSVQDMGLSLREFEFIELQFGAVHVISPGVCAQFGASHSREDAGRKGEAQFKKHPRDGRMGISQESPDPYHSQTERLERVWFIPLSSFVVCTFIKCLCQVFSVLILAQIARAGKQSVWLLLHHAEVTPSADWD